jgi:hypothetical protein
MLEMTPERKDAFATIGAALRPMVGLLEAAAIAKDFMDEIQNCEQVERERVIAFEETKQKLADLQAEQERTIKRAEAEAAAVRDRAVAEAERDARRARAKAQKDLDDANDQLKASKLEIIGMKRQIATLQAGIEAERAEIAMMLEQHPEVAGQFSN